MSFFTKRSPITSSTDQGLALKYNENPETLLATTITVAAGGVAGFAMLNAVPAATIATATAVGTLAYAGHEKSKGRDPWRHLKRGKKDDTTTDKTVAKSEKTEAKSEQQAEPEVAAA